MEFNKIVFPSFTGASVSVVYTELGKDSVENVYHSHIHDECEIYINVSGDVSFVVENHIYPIAPGSIIIARPGEYHHCVYHGDALHRHFWILFSADGMSETFHRFYDRNAGEGNLLTVSGARFTELCELCHSMCEQNVSNDEELYRFFKLIHILNSADVSSIDDSEGGAVIERALTYVNGNMLEPISVSEIADAAFVSVSTLERYFNRILYCSPSDYVKKRRLANAAELMKNGASVTYACQQSGFGDCSKFIQLFKKHYGQTPLQWKKQFVKS